MVEPIEREISLSTDATLGRSDHIRKFFISYNACERWFCFLKVKQTRLCFTFQGCSFEKNMATERDHDQ